jgi:hypothetical protein
VASVAATRVLALLGALFGTPVIAHAGGPTMSDCLAANDGAIKLLDTHELIEARDQSLVCASASCPSEVREVCAGRVARLSLAIPTLVLQARDASGNDVTHVVVTMDGRPFADHLDGTAIPVDPGEHDFELAPEGQARLRKHIVVYEGETNRREPIPIAGPATAPSPPSAVSSTPSTRVAEHSALGTQKIVGIGLGAAGLVAIAIGSGLGAAASSAWSNVESACGAGGTSSCAPTESRSAVTSQQRTAEADGTGSTVSFLAGGALVAAGLVVFLTGGHRGADERAPEALTMTPTVGPGQAGLGVRLAF